MNLSIYTSEFKKSLQIAYPIIIGQLGQILVGLADTKMIGMLGKDYLGASSLVNGFIFMFLSLGLGFSFAITTLTADAAGTKSTSKVRAVFKHGMVLTLASGILITIILIVAKPLLYNMNQPVKSVLLVDTYYNIVAFSMIPFMLFQGLKQFCDGLSFTKFAMKAIIIGNIINIALNYILINGLIGFPKLGVDGAAYGTVISRIAMFLIMLYYMISKEQLKVFTTKINIFILDKSIFSEIFKIGYPSALQMWFEVVLFVTAIFLSGVLGVDEQAANNVALNYVSMTFMLVTGLGITASIRIANQKALKEYIDLRRIAMSLFLLMLIISVIFSVIFLVFRNELVSFFILEHEHEVIKMTVTLLIIAAFFQLADGIQVVVLGALRGLQDVFMPMIITFVSYWVIGFPTCYYLGLHTSLQISGVWIGLLIGLTASASMLYLRFNYLSKKLIRNNIKISSN